MHALYSLLSQEVSLVLCGIVDISYHQFRVRDGALLRHMRQLVRQNALAFIGSGPVFALAKVISWPTVKALAQAVGKLAGSPVAWMCTRARFSPNALPRRACSASGRRSPPPGTLQGLFGIVIYLTALGADGALPELVQAAPRARYALTRSSAPLWLVDAARVWVRV